MSLHYLYSSRTSDKFGYDNVGNTTIKIKFDKDGNVVEKGVYTLYNSNVSAERIRQRSSFSKCTRKMQFIKYIQHKDEFNR